MLEFILKRMKGRTLYLSAAVAVVAFVLITTIHSGVSDQMAMANAHTEYSTMTHENEHDTINHDHASAHCHAECQTATFSEPAKLNLARYVFVTLPIMIDHQHQDATAPPLRPPKLVS